MTRTRQAANFMAAALLAGMPLLAHAQSPSSDQILNSLTPGVGHGGGTRGLRPGGPVTAAPTAPAPDTTAPRTAGMAPPRAPRPVPPVATADATPSVNLTVEFHSGSADLSPEAIHTLDNLGTALSNSKLARFRFRIEGHTDTVGSRDANKALSERRAATVVDYLVTHFKIDRARLDAVGMGEDGLLVPTSDQVSEPKNRRVLVVNLGA